MALAYVEEGIVFVVDGFGERLLRVYRDTERIWRQGVPLKSARQYALDRERILDKARD